MASSIGRVFQAARAADSSSAQDPPLPHETHRIDFSVRAVVPKGRDAISKSKLDFPAPHQGHGLAWVITSYLQSCGPFRMCKDRTFP